MRAKLILTVLLTITLSIFITTLAQADCTTLDYVDLGDPASEAGHAMAGWGPVEPETSGGGYGGVDNCRPIYAPEDGDDWATIEMDFGNDPTTCKKFMIHHLDGLTNDSFEVFIDDILVYTYLGDNLAAEVWYELKLDACFTGVKTVKFVSTAPQWSSWATYGQMCFDILEIEECPVDCGLLDMVDIGDPTSEAGHGLTGWGPVQPETSGGNYGGIDNCRAVYSPLDFNDWATLTLDFGENRSKSKCLTFRHLEGIGDDSFDLYLEQVGGPSGKQLVYSYGGDAQNLEIWLETSILVQGTGPQILTFVSTAPQWSSWATYGQMCFDTIRVDECPPLKAGVDIGDPVSEAGFNMVGWGPVEPETSSGSFGGIDNCRPIYAPEDGDDWATIDFDFGCCEGLKCLVLEHLDGLGDDSFDVFMYPVGDPGAAQLILSYPGDGLAVETWKTSSVLVTTSGWQTIKLVSTAPQWASWATYGQMCFNNIMVRDYLPVMDAVTIGDVASESGHAMVGWGPIEPGTSGGNYGGIQQCRAIYAPEDNDAWATIEMDFGYCAEGNKVLTLHHLDGLASDSFDVYIYPPGGSRPAVPFWSYAGDTKAVELWYKSCITTTLTGPQVVEFVSTEPVWDMWDIYGQVCFGDILIESGEAQDPEPYIHYPTGVHNGDMPTAGRITSIAPNPFNPKTEISFALNTGGLVELSIFDMRGHMVATLVNEKLIAGSYNFAWYGFDTTGRKVSSGVYFARLKIDDLIIQVEKVSMIK